MTTIMLRTMMDVLHRVRLSLDLLAVVGGAFMK